MPTGPVMWSQGHGEAVRRGVLTIAHLHELEVVKRCCVKGTPTPWTARARTYGETGEELATSALTYGAASLRALEATDVLRSAISFLPTAPTTALITVTRPPRRPRVSVISSVADGLRIST